MEPNTNYGGDIIDKQKRDKIEACVGWARSVDAKFWTYKTNTKECALKSSNTPLHAAPDSITNRHHISGSSACHDLVVNTETESRQNKIGSYVSYTSRGAIFFIQTPNHICPTAQTLFSLASPKQMNFRKSSKWPLIPPPHFWKIILQFFASIQSCSQSPL